MTKEELEKEVKGLSEQNEKLEKLAESRDYEVSALSGLAKDQKETIQEYEKNVPELEKEIEDLKAKLAGATAPKEEVEAEDSVEKQEHHAGIVENRRVAQEFKQKRQNIEDLFKDFEKKFKEILK